MISNDSGLTWKTIAKYINQFSWGIKAIPTQIPETRILVTY